MELTPQTMMKRIHDELARGRIDIDSFVRSFGIPDIEVGQLLMRAFDAGLLRGRLVARTFTFHGHVSGIADDMRPVRH